MPDRTRLTPTARSLTGRKHLLVSVLACAFIVPHLGERWHIAQPATANKQFL
jgi:hypothetical protein